MNATEALILARTVAAALAEGYSLSVFDGEETTVRNSTDGDAIVKALGTTEGDCLSLLRDGKREGSLWFVYGNEPYEVLADYSEALAGTLFMDRVVAIIQSFVRP